MYVRRCWRGGEVGQGGTNFVKDTDKKADVDQDANGGKSNGGYGGNANGGNANGGNAYSGVKP